MGSWIRAAGAKARLSRGGLAAPFDFAQGRLLEAVPSRLARPKLVFMSSRVPRHKGNIRGFRDGLAAPFDFAQGRLLEAVPSRKTDSSGLRTARNDNGGAVLEIPLRRAVETKQQVPRLRSG